MVRYGLLTPNNCQDTLKDSTYVFLLPTLDAGAEIFCLGLPKDLFCLGLPRDPSDGLPHLLFVLHWRPGRSVYPAHCQVS